MDDRIMQAAVRAYEYATDDDSVSQHGLRAAVSRALQIQRGEIAAAIEAQAQKIRDEAWQPAAGIAMAALVDDAARIAREHGKES